MSGGLLLRGTLRVRACVGSEEDKVSVSPSPLSSVAARRRSNNRQHWSKRGNRRNSPGGGQVATTPTLQNKSEIQSELNRFTSAFDRFELEGETEKRWHVVSIAGAKREQSYSTKLLEAFARELEVNRGLYKIAGGQGDEEEEEVHTLECMTPVIRYQYRSFETNQMVKRTVRWPASDVLWVRCILDNKMKAFLNRQSFVRNIFSGEPLVTLEDFAFQEQYDQARAEDEETLLSFTELLKHARLEEYHEIEDPEEVGLDVHQQLTELFYEKYLGTSPDAQGETAEPVEDQAEEYDDDEEEGDYYEEEDEETF